MSIPADYEELYQAASAVFESNHISLENGTPYRDITLDGRTDGASIPCRQSDP